MQVEQLFVFGAPRSGTSFTASLLEPTRFGAPVETHFIPKYFTEQVLDRRAFAKRLNAISKERPIMQWGLEFDPTIAFDAIAKDKVLYADLVNYIFWHRAGCPTERLCWGDKTPWYVGQIGLLDNLFPNAKYVYLVRDGRDVALSLLAKQWGPNNVWSAAKYWAELNKERTIFNKLQREGRFIYLFYEDLLSDPQAYVKSLYSFISEEISLETKDQLTKTMRSNKEKWRTSFDRNQVQVFESVAGGTLERFGYKLDSHNMHPISKPKQLLYYVDDKLRWAWFMFKQNVVDWTLIRFFGKEPFAD